jgi:hypothetical protein
MEKEKTKYEVFHKKRPNMQNIRLLPIFSILMVTRETTDKDSMISGKHNQIGLYVGPSLTTPGAIRAAVSTRGTISILTTSRFTAASQGGGFNIHQNVERGIGSLLNHNNRVSSIEEDRDDMAKLRRVTFYDDETEEDEQTIENKNEPNSRGAVLGLRRSPRLIELKNKRKETAQSVEHEEVDGIFNESDVSRDLDINNDILETAFFADWTSHEEGKTYFSYKENAFYRIDNSESAIDGGFSHSGINEDGLRECAEDFLRSIK